MPFNSTDPKLFENFVHHPGYFETAAEAAARKTGHFHDLHKRIKLWIGSEHYVRETLAYGSHVRARYTSFNTAPDRNYNLIVQQDFSWNDGEPVYYKDNEIICQPHFWLLKNGKGLADLFFRTPDVPLLSCFKVTRALLTQKNDAPSRFDPAACRL